MKRILKTAFILSLGLIACTCAPEATLAQSTLQLGCDEIGVMGAVYEPGRFTFQKRVPLSKVLARAGGVNGRAGKIVRVHHFCKCSPCDESVARSQSGTEYNLPRDENVYVQPGDLVIVPEMNFVLVTGNVSAPKSLVYRERMTLSQAIALAGGPVKTGDRVRIRIFRQVQPGKWSLWLVGNFKSLVDGSSEDNPLQPADSIEISDEEGRFLTDRPINNPIRDAPLRPRNSPDC